MIITVNKYGESIYKRIIEYKDFDFKAGTCVVVIETQRVNANGRGNLTRVQEQVIKLNKRALKREIDKCEDDINSGELICNAKNKRYVANLYRALKTI